MPNKRPRFEPLDAVEEIKTESKSLNYRIHTLVGEIRDLEESGDIAPYFADKEGGEALCTLKLKSPCCARISEMMLKCADSNIIMRYMKSYSVRIESPISAEFVFRSHDNTNKSVAIMRKAVELAANVAIMFDDQVRIQYYFYISCFNDLFFTILHP